MRLAKTYISIQLKTLYEIKASITAHLMLSDIERSMSGMTLSEDSEEIPTL
jgi:hypothetical protein